MNNKKTKKLEEKLKKYFEYYITDFDKFIKYRKWVF